MKAVSERIASVERLPDYDGEYVYDAEVDGVHTFFGNGVLLHNSIYVEFGRVCRYLGVPKERQAKFCVDLWDFALGPYMQQRYEDYAKKYNCDKNIQNLELEKISDVTLYFSKKRYAMSECWKEPNIYLPYMSKVIYKGIEIVKSTISSYARECMEDFVRTVLRWYGDHDEKVPVSVLQEKLKKYRAVFDTKSPDEISSGTGVGDYDKFILDDKNRFVVADKCPAHVRAAGIYNYLLNRPKNRKYKGMYQPIKSQDKVKWYYTTDESFPVFAYVPGSYPAEIAVPMDRDVQFEKTILSFCNKVLEIVGQPDMTASLCYTPGLF